MPDVALEAGYATSYFSKIFHESLGFTPSGLYAGMN